MAAADGVVKDSITEAVPSEISDNYKRKPQNESKPKPKRSASVTGLFQKSEAVVSISDSAELVDMAGRVAGSDTSVSGSISKSRKTASASKSPESQTAATGGAGKSVGVAITGSSPGVFETSEKKKTPSVKSDTATTVADDLREKSSQVSAEREKTLLRKSKSSKRKRNSSVTWPIAAPSLAVAHPIDAKRSAKEKAPTTIVESVKEDVQKLSENSGRRSATANNAAVSVSTVSLMDGEKELAFHKEKPGEATTVTEKSVPSISKRKRDLSGGRKSRRSKSIDVHVRDRMAVDDTAVCAEPESVGFLKPRRQSVDVAKNETDAKEVAESELTEATTPNVETHDENSFPLDEVWLEKGLFLAAMVDAETRPSAAVDDGEDADGDSGDREMPRGGWTRSDADTRNHCEDRRKICRQCGRDFALNSAFC